MNRTEKKLLQVKKIKVEGVTFEIKRVTPEDFLGKEGIPISKWQSEAEFIYNKQKEDGTTLAEAKKSWKKLFEKAIVSINKDYEIKEYLTTLLDNYFMSSVLYNEIINHCLKFKKKTILKFYQKPL